VTQLDFTGPYQVLVRTPGVRVTVASLGGKTIDANGLNFSSLAALERVDECTVLCVPGGSVADGLRDRALTGHIRRLGLQARYITSVCTGSLLLGAAGLIRGKRVACHWAYRDLLASFNAIPDAGRVVRDGNILSGGGVTAGIDFAFALAAELTDPASAQAVQLALEYAPAPPFEAGRPDTAPPDVLARVQERFAPMRKGVRAAIDELHARDRQAV
jgi:transcriptional regulator GlxA family with amidase domain